MAKGVKKIKEAGRGSVLEEFTSRPNNIICIKPNQMVTFEVSEWYDDTTAAEKENTIIWLWQDQKKTTIFHRAVKQPNTPFGVNLPKKSCGSYAYYLEASLYGAHDHRNTGLYVYGKCEEKITAASWSKKENTADTSEINYGNNLFINLETEGVNGDTLTLELYNEKNTSSAQTIKAKCIDGNILKAPFFTLGYRMFVPPPLENIEKFYLKVKDITGKYLTNASGSDKVLSISIVNKNAVPEFQIPTNNTPYRTGAPDKDPKEEEVKIEGILTAYFAKEEFTKETTEVDGQHEYIFASKNDTIDKDKIAGIIKKKVDAQVKANKKYAKLDDIKNALTATSYKKNDTITFALCKLGAEFKKINSAPLEEEVYVVAKTFLLDGKEVSITIKEKDVIVVDADAAIPVTEAKENGAELTTLKATVENGIAKIKVKLRPKADEDLKKWKEKLLKGKKDEAYSYKFKNDTTITADNKKQLATIICNNAKQGKQDNPKIADGKTAFADDVEKALENKTYSSVSTITFDTYKTLAENLWLKAECQGDTKKHEGEFLKRDGEYFVIGEGGCPRCETLITAKEFKEMFPDVTQLFQRGTNTLSSTTIDGFLEVLNKTLKEFKINTCVKKAFFLAQISKETGFFSRIDENLYYTTEEALHSFWSQASHPKLYSNPSDFYQNPQKLGNYVYRNVAENSDEGSGDGYKFRGRGLIQITRKKGYRRFGEFAGKDFTTNPDILLED
jgi:predicted chitinase